MLTFFTAPTSTTVASVMTDYGGMIFDGLVAFALMAAALASGGIIVSWLTHIIPDAIARITHRDDR